jgi:hypothetical protein
MMSLNSPKKYALFQFAFLASMGMTRASTEISYHVRSRAAQQDTIVLNNAQDFVLSFSEDGGTKTLPVFFLDLFATAPELTSSAQSKVEYAINEFLLPAANEFFKINPVVDILTEILNSETIISTNSNGHKLEGRQGTALEIQLKLNFDFEPSPHWEEVALVVKTVMQDLSLLVTGIASYGDEELKGVDEAYRRELPTQSPTAAPNDNANNVIDGNPNDANPLNGTNNPSALQIVPMVMAGASLVALGAFFVFRRKRQSSVSSPKGDMLYVDVEGDIYSMDPSLESSARGSGRRHGMSPSMSNSSQSGQSSAQSSLIYNGSSVSSRAMSPMAGDSVFSGLESPRHSSNIRASKSLLSGFTNASSATIQVSNQGTSKSSKNRLLGTPNNMGKPGSLLTAFVEDGEEDYEEERQGRDPPRMTGTEDSDDDSRENNDTLSPSSDVGAPVIVKNNSTNVLGGVCEKWYSSNNAESATPKDVLDDLADFASSREPSPRDPTPTSRRRSKSREPTPRGGSENNNQLIPSPSIGNSLISYASLVVGCTPSTVYDEKTYQKTSSPMTMEMEPTPARDVNLSSAKVLSNVPQVSSPLARALRKQRSFSGDEGPKDGTRQYRRAKSMGHDAGHMSIDSTTDTPLKKNINASPDARPDLTKSEPSLIHLEWDDHVQAPGTVGAMSAKATQIVSGVFGGGSGPLSFAATGPSRSIATTTEGGSAPGGSTPGTPKSPKSPSRGNVGPLESLPAGAFKEHIGGPSSPGAESENPVTLADYGASQSCMSPYSKLFGRSSRTRAQEKEDPPTSDDEDGGCYPSNKRRHAGNAMGQDGSALYQANAMHPLDWSYKSADIQSVGDSTLSEVEGSSNARHFAYDGKLSAKSPTSYASQSDSYKTKDTRDSGHLISDLVWLEKKIAKNRGGGNDPYAMALSRGEDSPALDRADSLSYQSNDNEGFVSPSSNGDHSGDEPSMMTGVNNSVMSSIVCQDVYAPPGKLHIVIHSTKDGPAVHTVKEGSSLEGHLFSGDLIIAVDNVDTRGYTAEQVMKMMASRSAFDRKITVLHFDEEGA